MRKILTLALAIACVGCPTDISSALRAYGYAPVRPASQLWTPGAMVYVRSRDPYQVGIVCTAEQMLGPGYKPLESITNNADLQRASKRGLTIAANVREIVTTDVELQAIKSVKMHLRNVKISEVSDFQIQNGLGKTDPGCIRAILRRRRQGFDVTMISAAISADVSYTVNWSRESKLDVEAKVAAVQNLSAKLGVENQRSSDKTIEANGLIWGIRDDAFLAYLFDPAHCPQVRPHTQLFDPSQVPDLTVSTGSGHSPLDGATLSEGDFVDSNTRPEPLPGEDGVGAEDDADDDADDDDDNAYPSDGNAVHEDDGADAGAVNDQGEAHNSSGGVGGRAGGNSNGTCPTAAGADTVRAAEGRREGGRPDAPDATDAKRSTRPSRDISRKSWAL